MHRHRSQGIFGTFCSTYLQKWSTLCLKGFSVCASAVPKLCYTVCVNFHDLCCLRSTTFHFLALIFPLLVCNGQISTFTTYCLPFLTRWPRRCSWVPMVVLGTTTTVRGQEICQVNWGRRSPPPPTSVTAQRLLQSWQSQVLLPLATTVSKPNNLFGTHLAAPASWPSLKCIALRQNKWMVSKYQPFFFFFCSIFLGG